MGGEMTRDAIIRMAREAGFNWAWISEGQQRLERFYRAAYAAGAAAEREACARLCEKMETYGDPVQCWLDQCAAAIRTRGEA